MKKYICDICKKEFGHNVSTFIQPMYQIQNFDSIFYTQERYDADICPDCFNRIAKAQKEEIERIKKVAPK